ncbi:MAG: hypothetical protein LBR17_07230, partial [Bacteroidales bacterium]|jgi:hypothetical protein|nr:hypothetical protein [Bacteroidales bacterium]MDR1847889.1 hypothetical protein [Bacteroidales bacterium]
MKAAFITYNQAHIENVERVLNQLAIRGFTRWTDVQGRGSKDGEPHLGSHAWPAKNMATLCIIEDSTASLLKKMLRGVDSAAPAQGLRVFFWDIVDV